MKFYKYLTFVSLSMVSIFIMSSCKKEVIIDGNKAPFYDEISTLLIENYVNRIYIDLIGREPLDSEMTAEVSYLRDADLSMSAREQIIIKLQTDTSYVFGDSSYTIAYHKRFYELAKARVIEGASNQEVQFEIGIIKNQIMRDSMEGNWAAFEQHMLIYNKLFSILSSEYKYRNKIYGIDSVFAKMVNNSIYDKINMNTFNFINATFDNLYYRYPTQTEFDKGYNMVEYNQSETLFGKAGSNKDQYVTVLVSTREFYEGCVIWAYQTLLARDPNSSETYDAMIDFYYTHDFALVQKNIMITDEYAGFD